MLNFEILKNHASEGSGIRPRGLGPGGSIDGFRDFIIGADRRP
jgi:hypothetical protein